ncbi:MAG: transglutaminase-like domain-containing protein [Bacteroidales bacterium]
MKNFALLLLSTMLFACGGPISDKLPTPEQIDKSITKGEFTEAAKLINFYLTSSSFTPSERYELNFKLLRMDRIRQDFCADDTTVISYLKRFYPKVTKEEIEGWESTNALENLIIDGKKKYFRSAGRNLFRIDSIAAKHFTDPNGGQSDSLNRFLAWHIPSVVKEAHGNKSAFIKPVKMKIRYTVTVKPNEVPAGEVIRVWMPFPRQDTKAHSDIKLISTTQPEYLIAPDGYAHKSIYMEGVAKTGQPVKFGFELSYTSYAQCFRFKPEDILPYNTQDSIYREYTSERAPHIVFSEKIKSLTKEVVGEETNPYLKVRKIWEWIDKNFPWASAREYSTIENIPEYVLTNRHGDCGQVSLLFITMARCAGVPAKWQSGWMMHPGNVNLHDWAEVYYPVIGWVPVDQSFGRIKSATSDEESYYFYSKGLDAYRMIVNGDISRSLYPAKIHPRSETVDFQRGEVEWRGENLYFGRWNYDMEVEYL